MSLWRLILQDLDVLLSESVMTTKESRNMKSTIDLLRRSVMYIIPFWNDCPWKMSQKTEVYEQMIKSRLENFVNRDEFVDYWMKQLYCFLRPRWCSAGNECLLHAADEFYFRTRTPFSVESTEHVLECLESVQSRNSRLSLAEETQFNKIKQGLKLLTYFRKSMALWDFENWEQTKALTCDRYKCAEELLRRAIIIFKMVAFEAPKSERQAELSSLVNDIRSCLCDWCNIRKLKPLKLMDSDASTDHVETFQTEGPVVLISDVEAGILEAADVYILFFRDSEDDLPSSTVEVVDGFKASVRHAYAEYVKLPEMETPMSELEFFDMLVNMREFKECNGYFSDRIGALSDDLSTCFTVLQQNTFRHVKPGEVKHLWTQIMKLGRKVEHMIDTFKELPNWFNELRVFSVSEEVKLIKENLSKFSRDEARDDQRKQGQTIDRSKDEAGNNHQTQDKDHIVSFEEEGSLTTQLTTGSKRLEKIAVVGMPGLGKTTLALNLYKDCAKFFYAHAWCHVGQDFERKELLRDLTGQISERPSSEINDMREEDLAKLLKQSLLKKKNYLIVLDDVWDVEAWNALQICFPLGNNGSRILLTSRSKTIGERVCGDRNVLELNLLSTDKSWNLLQKKVFGAKKCPQTLSQIGEGIAKKCDGLPLSIVVIAGVLKNKEKTKKNWYEVAESLDTYLVDGVLNTLELSYKHLSVCMKQCFLYCITFLKGKEIPRSKLVQMWVAEKFVEESDQQESLEAAAEKYLSGLVDRSLLMVAKTGSDKRFQAFRIHDLLHDFCVQKAKEEKFMITINGWDDPAGRQRCSRLCFRSIQDRFPIFNCKEESWQQTIRSLTTSTYRRNVSERCDTSFIFENFKSLTLLDLESVAMDDIMSGSVAGLKSLRFLAIRGCMDRIPSSIGELFNLETLIVKGTRGEVDIPETIFKLRKLRHLKVTKRAYVRVEHKTLTSLNSLQSFSTPVLSWSPGKQTIKQLPNLRKLRCIFLHESSDLSILNCLCHLESLRVLYHGPGRFSGKLSFPSNLYKLTLSKFRLPWSEIEKIATLLPQLEILKLLFKAFEGHTWTTTTTFKNLKYLRMEELDIKEWKASDDNFPRLEQLIVRRCKLLHKIPEDLGNIGDLMGIEAHWCEASVAKSVLKIKKQQRNDGNMKFETIIYPTVLDLDDDDDDDDDDEFSE